MLRSLVGSEMCIRDRVLRDASNSPSYPVTAGTPELRAAIKKWAVERLGATGDFDVLPVIGSKELVAWLPTILESKKVLIPEIAYPTYHVGAVLAAAESIPVAIDAKSWPHCRFSVVKLSIKSNWSSTQ